MKDVVWVENDSFLSTHRIDEHLRRLGYDAPLTDYDVVLYPKRDGVVVRRLSCQIVVLNRDIFRAPENEPNLAGRANGDVTNLSLPMVPARAFEEELEVTESVLGLVSQHHFSATLTLEKFSKRVVHTYESITVTVPCEHTVLDYEGVSLVLFAAVNLVLNTRLSNIAHGDILAVLRGLVILLETGSVVRQ